jgi:hypothetical protein
MKTLTINFTITTKKEIVRILKTTKKEENNGKMTRKVIPKSSSTMTMIKTQKTTPP